MRVLLSSSLAFLLGIDRATHRVYVKFVAGERNCLIGLVAKETFR